MGKLWGNAYRSVYENEKASLNADLMTECAHQPVYWIEHAIRPSQNQFYTNLALILCFGIDARTYSFSVIPIATSKHPVILILHRFSSMQIGQ